MLSHSWALFRSELRSEVRTGEVLSVTIPFGAAALVLIPMAVGIDTPLLDRIGPGLYFSVVLLFGVLISQRRTADETTAQRDLLTLLGVDPAARFAARASATTTLILGFEVVAGAVTIVLYDPTLTGWWWLALLLPLTAAGLGLLGTIAAAAVSSTSNRVALTPLLVVPLAVPILLAATQAVEGLRMGTGILSWVLLLAATDLVLVLAGVVSAGPLEESAQ